MHLPSTRTGAKWLTTLIFAVALSPVAGQWFVKLAEQWGFYDDPAAQVAGLRAMISQIANDPRYIALVAFLGGLALGMWLDSFLKRRENSDAAAAPAPILTIQREALADEAEQLARKLGAWAARWAARQQAAWQEDMRYPNPSNRERSGSVRNQSLEEFGDFYPEVALLIAKARKFVALDRTDLWHMESILSSGQDMSEVVRLVTGIAVSLRHSGPDVPESNKRMEEALAIQKQQLSSIQSPSTPAT